LGKKDTVKEKRTGEKMDEVEDPKGAKEGTKNGPKGDKDGLKVKDGGYGEGGWIRPKAKKEKGGADSEGGWIGPKGKGAPDDGVETKEEDDAAFAFNGPSTDLDEKGEEEAVGIGLTERAPWKRIGLAVGVAIGIDAAFLPVIFLPVLGVIVMLMLVPYLGAFIGGRWLKKERKGEWIGATAWLVLTWPSILVLIMLGLLRTLGTFDLVIELYASLIIGMVYFFPAVFTLVGFYHGSRSPDERDWDGTRPRAYEEESGEGTGDNDVTGRKIDMEAEDQSDDGLDLAGDGPDEKDMD
jgi:hypothetical protein